MEKLELQSLVSVIHGDLRDIDLSTATVIVLYLLPESIELIKAKLYTAIENGTILICNTWGPKGLKPFTKVTCGPSNNCHLYAYDKSSLVVAALVKLGEISLS